MILPIFMFFVLTYTLAVPNDIHSLHKGGTPCVTQLNCLNECCVLNLQ